MKENTYVKKRRNNGNLFSNHDIDFECNHCWYNDRQRIVRHKYQVEVKMTRTYLAENVNHAFEILDEDLKYVHPNFKILRKEVK